MTIKPGTLCLVIKSTGGNEGREVVALRQVSRRGRVPEHHPVATARHEGWVVRARHPLRGLSTLRGADHTVAVFPTSWLLPLLPPPATTTTSTTEPVPCVTSP